MGNQVMQLLVLGGFGWAFYYLLRGIGQREMAGLLQITCYALGVVLVLQIILDIMEKVNNSTIVRFLNSPSIKLLPW